MLLIGTIQGSLAYADYCYDGEYDHSNTCKFKGNSDENYVDFVAVVTLSGVGALFWVSSMFAVSCHVHVYVCMYVCMYTDFSAHS